MDEIEVPSPWRKRLLYLGLLLIGLLIIGGVGQLSGAGWFGYRSYMYGETQVYLLNLSDENKTVTVTGMMDPIEVAAQGAEIVDVIGGDLEIKVLSKNGESQTMNLFADDASALVKLSKQGCLTITNLTAYYGGEQPKDPDYEAFIQNDKQVYVIPSRNVVWPRKPFPRSLDAYGGPGMWVELIGCEILNDRTMLDGYVVLRLQERMNKAMKKK